MFKNTTAKFIVFAFDYTTGAPKTGDAANITCYVSKDYGAATVLADTSATEIDATNAKGYYLFDAAQGETNADCLLITAKSSTANVSVIGAPAVIYTRPQTGWLAPTVAGRTLDVSAGGEAGVDWANVGSPTTANALTGTTIATTQKVDVETIKTQAVTCAAGVTVLASVGTAATSTAQTGDAFARLGAPAGASVSADIAAAKADTAAILDDTGTSGVVVGSIAANAINAAAIATGALTSTKFAAGAIDAAALSTDAANEIRDAVWAKVLSELTGDPGATPTTADAIMLPFMAIRNKRDTDSGLGTDEIHNSAGTVILTAAITDAAGVFSKAKYA